VGRASGGGGGSARLRRGSRAGQRRGGGAWTPMAAFCLPTALHWRNARAPSPASSSPSGAHLEPAAGLVGALLYVLCILERLANLGGLSALERVFEGVHSANWGEQGRPGRRSASCHARAAHRHAGACAGRRACRSGRPRRACARAPPHRAAPWTLDAAPRRPSAHIRSRACCRVSLVRFIPPRRAQALSGDCSDYTTLLSPWIRGERPPVGAPALC
jgi:hypothetical protein